MAVMSVDIPDPEVVKTYQGLSPYRDFLASEGVPIYEEYSVDCKTLAVQPWARLGGSGAYIHLTGRSDFLNAYIHEIPAGGQTKVEQHIFEKLVYVVSGRGSTSIELPSGRKHVFEWGAGAAFGIPLNARHQYFNGSGSEPARLMAVTTAPITIGLYHNNLGFIFDNPAQFPQRFGQERYFNGEGEFRAVSAGRHQWETNFVPDMNALDLPVWYERGAGGSSITLTFAEGVMHSHISHFDSGTYKKAHFHNAGANIVLVSGHGYSLLWREGEDPLNSVRVDWKPGVLFAPPDGPTYHQHFNTSAAPARYLVFGPFSSRRYNVMESAMSKDLADVSAKEGGIQVEYEDEDPRILELFEDECAKAGVPCHMRGFLGRAGKR